MADVPLATPAAGIAGLLPQSLPIAGTRFALARPPGSADALLLAQAATEARREGRLLVIVAADALDAQRLVDEIPYFGPALMVRPLPDWETLPYDTLSPHQDLVSERLETLFRLSQGARGIDVLVVPATTALYRLAPPQYVAGHTFFFRQGETVDAERLRTQLVFGGYQHVSQVVAPGEFAIRGGLIDLFPMGSRLPYRLDLMDAQLETIRAFDPDTQRGLYPVPEVRLLPGREFPIDETARQAFRRRWRDRIEGDPSRSGVYKDVGSGIASAGIEYYLPLFFDETATLFDYLPATAVVALHGPVEAAMQRFWNETSERHRFLARDAARPILPPSELFLNAEAFFTRAKDHGRVTLAEPAADLAESPFVALPPLAVERRAEDPVGRLRRYAEDYDGRILIVADSAGRRETIGQMLAEYGVPFGDGAGFEAFVHGAARLALGVAPLHEGFALREPRLTVITETELYAASPRRLRGKQRERASNVEAMIRDLAELRVGDPVVHVEHGIGRYLGLQTMELGSGPTEFLQLEYANEATLYVPVAQLHLIGRYSGADPAAAPLHQLGSGDWDKARRKAAKQVRDTAAELLNLYALRAARKGHAFQFRQHDYEAFAEGFGFEETPDQQAAIDAVLKDMGAGFPMDRLVCGDVGFGKTEVALRAAFAAVAGGRQVAVLCPTTLLAEQHVQTFRDRFSQWPVNIVELSRFRSSKEVAEAVAGMNAGTVDIVIGTHKLLSEDVKFGRLGLVIIDEEHRFGVRQKERLKALRAEVDVLTLTATPIPRTLAMSLEGIREFSVIATAPQRRLAIKTFVRKETASLMREAVLRELKRGGQVYFLHNEVETIENRRARLAELLPEARIEIAHGQMPERELERVMRDFYQQRFNVLLCSTIIETGIDVPTANTIIIHRADKFGLAQLHQLRGRVGRSHHQAYAYLMVPDEGGLTKNAEKRLEAIQNLEELGSGFYLAMHDLEIRGAGEVLGESQSGNMQEVGFDLYTQMLNAAVRALRSGREPDLLAPLAAVTEINLHVPALLPPDYVNDVHQRLSMYKKLASCDDEDSLIGLQEELVDRYGKLPEAARALIETHRLRLLAERLGVRKIDASGEAILIQFMPDPPFDTARLIALMQRSKTMRLAGPERLRIEEKLPVLEGRLARLREVFRALL
ncbi:MAG TPA: transcription-repair coupling factor [Burkholderiaceae bacterium]|nr:transcription-repair coupling factor [Burkholderiaceae bacterium]HQR70841.1 transcription-repair coupling factor [Burkholderiaceae bacterium]